MTQREFYIAVIAETEYRDVLDFAKEGIAKLDKRNEKRKNTPSKAQIENAPLKKAIMEILTAEPKTASEIAETIGITTQKASAILRQMDILKTEVKIKGKGKVNGYFVKDVKES